MFKLKKDPIDNLDVLIKTNEEGRESFIPFDPANTDFVEYQKWLSEGNTPIPADEPNA